MESFLFCQFHQADLVVNLYTVPSKPDPLLYANTPDVRVAFRHGVVDRNRMLLDSSFNCQEEFFLS